MPEEIMSFEKWIDQSITDVAFEDVYEIGKELGRCVF